MHQPRPTRTPFGRTLHEGLAVRATSGVTDGSYAVVFESGTGRSGSFCVYLSTDEARAMAAALVAAADHHDAETAAGAVAVAA